MPAACAIQAGYTIDCRESIGGLQAVFIAEFGHITSVAEVSGLVTGITKATGKKFFKFEIPRAVANATSNGTGSEENGSFFFTHQVVFPINKRDSTTANIIRVLAKNKCIVVTLDMDGNYRMYGKGNGLFVSTVDSGSGTAAGDRQGYNITLTGIEKDEMLQVNSTTGLALETAG
jgi:hypothetical protein